MNKIKIIIIICCLVIAGIQSINIYKNIQKNIDENYVKTNAEIAFVGKSGTGIRTRTLIIVKYDYDNETYTGTIRRAYRNNGYYKTGDEIIINVNKNDPKNIE
jgi:hypothetical protein